ncbi:MAG: LysM peptidoglycan-binding domain-containing protein [Eubacteriaceae bacterium]|nr:LysM peptidoglycan-binding domain-containing protein [Eubacteriaceae bacterium]
MEKMLKAFKEESGEMKNRFKSFLVSGFITAAIAVGVFAYQSSFSYIVYFNGEKIGIVQEASQVEDAIAVVEGQMVEKYGAEAYIKGETSFEKIGAQKDKQLDEKQLETLIIEQLEVYKPAAVIMVDGEEKLAVGTKAQADSILEDVKKTFVDKVNNGGSKIESLEVAFAQKVEVVSKDVPVSEILSHEDALNAVNQNGGQVQTYTVAQGDNAWNISRAFKTGIRTIQEANPDKDITNIKPGETINLSTDSPLIDVTITTTQIDKAAIGFTTEKQSDGTQYTGVSKVVQEGQNGEKEVKKTVTYRNGNIESEVILEETIIKAPVAKIVMEGTKIRPAKVSRSASSRTAAPTYNGDLGSAIVATAKHYIGTPYRSGGSTPAGFDCSGFTSYVYRQYGISLPRTSGGQASAGGYVAKSDLRPGDLVIFSGHVGIYVGNNSFIHSPSPGKSVMISSLGDSYWRSTYISGRRVY